MAIISRRQYDHPALATAGGSALHASITNLYTVLGDDSMSRYKTFTAVANSSVGVIAHEFGLDFANLKVQIFTGTYPALTLVSDPIGSGWTVAATSGLASRSIDVTAPASGGPHTYAVLVSHESNASQYIPGLVSIGTQSFAGAKTFLSTVTFPTPFTLGAVSVTATGVELNYSVGVTSLIQSQLNLKAPLASPTFTTTVNIPDGSVTVPGLAFSSDADGTGTGLYRVSTNSIGIAFNGINRWTWSNAGAVTHSANAPSTYAYTIENVSGVDSSTNALKVTANTSSSARIISLQNAGTERFAVTGVGDILFGNNGSLGSITSAAVCTLKSTSTNAMILTGGTTVASRLQIDRGTDDANQYMEIGWNIINSVRANGLLSGNQSNLSFQQRGSDGTRIIGGYDVSGLWFHGISGATGTKVSVNNSSVSMPTICNSRSFSVFTDANQFCVQAVNGSASYSGIMLSAYAIRASSSAFNFISCVLGDGTNYNVTNAFLVDGTGKTTIGTVNSTAQNLVVNGTVSFTTGSGATNQSVNIIGGSAATTSSISMSVTNAVSGTYLRHYGELDVAADTTLNGPAMQFIVARANNTAFATKEAFGWYNFGTLLGKITAAGAWTLGYLGLSGTHKINGITHMVPSVDTTNTVYIGFRDAADSSNIGSITRGGASLIDYNTASDERIKKNFTESSFGLATVMSVPVYEYDFISDDVHHNGFKAQDLHAAYPFAARVGGEDPLQEPWMVDYSKVTPVLWKAIQELSAKNDALEARIYAIEN